MNMSLASMATALLLPSGCAGVLGSQRNVRDARDLAARNSQFVGPRGMRLRAIAIVLPACFVWATHGYGQMDLPPRVQALVEESEEAFFDGDFKNAARLIAEAEKWIDNDANKRDLARLGADHSLIKVMLTGLRAEIFQALGEIGKARGALRHAEAVLNNRRAAYVKRRIFPPMMWQYEAFLQFVRGDLMRPVPDFGLSDDPELSERVKRLLAEVGKATESIRAYRDAEATMSKPMARQESTSSVARRLQGRLFVSLARTQVLKAGIPTPQDVADAEAFLERANSAYAGNKFWNQCIKQENFGEIPRAFKHIDAKALEPEKKLESKRLFAQTIQDWLSIQLLKIELTAFQEMGDDAAVDTLVQSAEQRYDRLVSFLKSQYKPTHPVVQQARLSRARWLVGLARSPVAAPETRFSWLQDALVEVGSVTNLAACDMLQRTIIELTSLLRLLNIDSEINRLNKDQRRIYASRIVDLQEKVEAFGSGKVKDEELTAQEESVGRITYGSSDGDVYETANKMEATR